MIRRTIQATRHFTFAPEIVIELDCGHKVECADIGACDRAMRARRGRLTALRDRVEMDCVECSAAGGEFDVKAPPVPEPNPLHG